jgi:dihydroorotate dehydrogenase electron transfer subunit
MSQLEAGEKLDILTPLGNGFEMAGCQKPVLIGGGAGIPPMYGLCKRFIEQGIKPEVIMGFNKESEAFYIEEFEKLGADVKVTTVDGSLGIKGFVTDSLTNKQDAFYACGPEAMLRAIDRTADPNMKGYMSFEERMGCGFGACMGCSCKTKYGSKRICKDGPVLERSEVIW